MREPTDPLEVRIYRTGSPRYRKEKTLYRGSFRPDLFKRSQKYANRTSCTVRIQNAFKTWWFRPVRLERYPVDPIYKNWEE